MTEGTDSEPGQSLVGTVLAGRYRIESLLGSGGMGSVYRAEHVLMRKACAVKVLHREMTQVKEVVARFEREAVAAARIEHPNVATATDFGQLENGSFYLVLEFIEGMSLARLIAEQGALPEQRALGIVRQIADALGAAHGAGIVHRDLKPDNVMLVSKDSAADFVKVLDFGIAKVKLEGEPGAEQQALTRLNSVMGTPEYMAPEQARGEDVDLRADLYMLGTILYEMLSGKSPFRHEEFVVILTKKLTEDPPPLPEHVSPATRELVSRLLQRDPKDRPQSAAEIAASIDGMLGFTASPASAVFAPVSGQVAASKRASMTSEVANESVAYANTVVGMAAPEPVEKAEKAWIVLLKGARQQVMQLARRRLALGSRQVPLGLIGGALFGLPVLLALLLTLGSQGSSVAAEPTSGVAALNAPLDDDLSELMQRAESGDRPALAELLSRAAEAKSAPVYRALGRGYFKLGQLDAGLRAYRSGGALDPSLGDSPEVLADLRLGLADAPNQQLTLEVAAVLGAGGADFLYGVWDDKRPANAALSKQAKALLDSERVQLSASPALKVLLDLAKAKAEGCAALKKVLPRVEQSGDARVVPQLTRLNDRKGCGFLGLGDCFGCLRRGKDLSNAQKAAAERAAPKVGG